MRDVEKIDLRKGRATIVLSEDAQMSRKEIRRLLEDYGARLGFQPPAGIRLHETNLDELCEMLKALDTE